MKNLKFKSMGMSLIEVMATMTLVVIVAGVAIYSYTTFVAKKDVAVFQTFLAEVATKQADFYQNKRKYASSPSELGVEIPANLVDKISGFKITSYKDDSGRYVFLAGVIPNYESLGLQKVLPLAVDSDNNRYFSKQVMCQSVKTADSDAIFKQSCGYVDSDEAWTKRKSERIVPTLANIESGAIVPPTPIAGVNNGCAYAIGMRDKELFTKLECSETSNWPYLTENPEPISDLCLDAFNSGDAASFSANKCCSQINWIKKNTSCSATGAAVPTSPEAYDSEDNAGTLKFGKKCIIANSLNRLALTTCDSTNDSQKWFKSDDGLWHSKNEPDKCMTASGYVGNFQTNGKLTTCNPNNKWQKIVYNENDKKFHVAGYCLRWSGRFFQTISCNRAPAVAVEDIEAEFSPKPACYPAVLAKDYNTFYAEGCCSLGKWQENDISCNSKPITLATSADTGTRLEFSPGFCLRPNTYIPRGSIYIPVTAGIDIAERPCSYTKNDKTNNWFTDSDGLMRNSAYPGLCMSANAYGANTAEALTLEVCNSSDAKQKFSTLGGQLRTSDGKCITAHNYTTRGSVRVGPYNCKSTASFTATDPRAKFAEKPACDVAMNNNDFNSFSSAGCCELGNWDSQEINCGKNSNLVLPTTFADAKQLAQNGGCLMLRNDGNVAQHSCDGSYPATKGIESKWYTDKDGLIHLASDTDKCLTAIGSNVINGASLKLKNCNTIDDNQKFEIVGGQIRRAKDGKCLTVHNRTRTGDQWVGAYTCSVKNPEIELK